VKRAPIALFAALVTGMALVAAGLVGDHFGFRNWPMSPAPQAAQHVTVTHPTLATYTPEKRADEPSPATHAAESADNSLPAGSARGATQLVSQHRAVRSHRGVARHGSKAPNNSDESGGGSAGGGNAGNHATTTQTQGTPPATTTPAPSGSQVSAASVSTPAATTPATSDPAPADPQPAPPAPATPAPPADPAPPTTGGGNGEQGSGHGRHHGPVGQLLHDLLGLGNVQG
jgi:hypothetical protein